MNIHISKQEFAMPLPAEKTDSDAYEAACDEAIAACNGDERGTIKALLVANGFLEAQVAELQAAVSQGYVRTKFEAVPVDRKDWYD